MSRPQHNVGFTKKIDTIELSDAFRRHASYGRPDLVKEMVRQARFFAAATTWYNHGEPWFHERVLENTVKAATRMAEIAKKLGATEVSLPVTSDRRSQFTSYFEKKVLPQLKGLGVAFTLQQGEYSQDLSHLGRIDHRIKTAIDEGLRGMASIDDELKYKWALNPKP